MVFSEPKNTPRVRALFKHFLSLPASGSEGEVSADEIAAVAKAFGFEPLAPGQVQKTYLTQVGSGPLVLDHTSGEGDKRLTSLLDPETGLPAEEFSLQLPEPAAE